MRSPPELLTSLLRRFTSADSRNVRSGWTIDTGRLWGWALTPIVAFPALWICGMSAAQIHVLHVQSRWSLTTWVVMAEVPAAFIAGGLLARRLIGARTRAAASDRFDVVLPGRLIAGLLVVGALGLAYQFVRAGKVPLLTSHVDSARVSLRGGAAALLADALTVTGAAAIAIPSRLRSREAAPALGVAAVSVVGFALAGGRGTAVLTMSVGLLARWLFWRRPPLRVLLLAALVVGGFASLLFYVRTRQEPLSQAFPAELYGSVVPSTPAPLIPLLPLHFALAMPFEALARIIDYFPTHMAFGGGVYDGYGLHAILPARSLGAVSASLSAPWLVSTAAGPLWADGGAAVVAAGMLVTGALTSVPHAVFSRSQRFGHALLAAYFLYLGLFGVYTSLITQYKDWVVIAAGLWWVGRASQRGAAEPGPPDQARTAPAGPTLRDVSGDPPVPTGDRRSRRRLFTLGGSILLVALIGAVIIAASDRRFIGQSPTAMAADEHLALRGVAVGRADTMLTDAELPVNESPIWVVRKRSGRLGLTIYKRAARRWYTGVNVSLPRDAAPLSQYAIAHHRGAERLYVITPRRGEVTVTSLDPVAPRRSTTVGRLTLGRPQSGAVRSFFVAHWSGASPDLFVVDQGSHLARMSVRVYSGDSHLRRQVLAATVSLSGLDPRNWIVQLARIDARPDLVLIERNSPGGYTEVHVVTGTANFQRFTLQERVAVPRTEIAYDSLIVGKSLGAPSLLAIDRRSGDRVGVYHLEHVAPGP